MASKYRLGTTVKVDVYVSNIPDEILGPEMGIEKYMYVRSEYGTFQMQNVNLLTDEGGKPIGITGKFAGIEQKYPCKYDVIVIMSTKRLCIDEAFELVKHIDEADTEETTQVNFECEVSFLSSSSSVSGYEEWRQTNDGTIQDYWDWLRNGSEELREALEKETEERKAADAKLLELINLITGGASGSFAEILDLIDTKLSKTDDDTAAGLVTFLKGIVSDEVIKAKGGVTFGEFTQGLYDGSGASIDSGGNAEVESIRVRSFMEVMELVINRVSAIEGDVLLTESDSIESVENLGSNNYRLHLKSKWEGYYTAQAQNNIIMGKINTLASGSGTYYTSWMRVNSVDTASNSIDVLLYPDDDTPAGRNYPPCEMMKIARWGNQSDTKRQSCLYLSSTEGRITKLVNVTTPKIDKSNYGVTIGTLPEFVKSLTDIWGNPLQIWENRDYIYAPGIITTDILRINYQGKPIAEIVDRGEWSQDESYYAGDYNEVTEKYEISDVWYKGCKYRCSKSLTKEVPSWKTTDWAMIEGNPNFYVDFVEAESVYDLETFKATLTIVAMMYNQDVTDNILNSDFVWTRYSEDEEGNQREDSDAAWAIRKYANGSIGKQISLTKDDLDINGYMPPVIRFTCTVTLRDSTGEEAAKESVIFTFN